MKPIRLAATIVLLTAGAATAQVPASPVRLKVMTSGGFAAPLAEVLPEFEKASGISVDVVRGASQGPGPDTIAAQLRRGVPADMVILSREGLNDLIAEGRIVAHSDIDLASTPLGLSVRAGAAKPDIGTLDALRQTLLHARSITFPASTSGAYLTKTLFPRLGIEHEMVGKSSNAGVAAVARGDAELTIQPESELLHVFGTDFVDPLPAQGQFISVFSAAQVSGSGNQAAARQLIDFLSSGKTRVALPGHGMSPAGAH
jgi:molybdate transport system substrate-binding protein